MPAAPTRLFLGCVAGAVSVLMFHQTTLQIFFWLGLAPQAAFRIGHGPPFNMPMVLSITFWGAVYGGLFGLLMPRMRGPIWLNGLLLGCCAMLVAWFVFLPLKGQPIAFDWRLWPMLRSATAYASWGFGVGICLPVMHPRPIGASRPSWMRSGLAI
jgi:hypothetical protein